MSLKKKKCSIDDIDLAVDMANFQYEYQKWERNKPTFELFSHYGANWPCFWGEEIIGDYNIFSNEETRKKYWDGWKYTCGLRKIKSPCIVYSLGSNGNLAFEKDIFRVNKNCEIYIFDKENYEYSSWLTPSQQKMVHFEKAFISNEENLTSDPPIYNLFTIMKKYGHNHIDVLKMDIDGSEFGVLNDPLPSIGQLQVEIHLDKKFITGSPKQTFEKTITNLEKHNLRLFHKEANYWGQSCMEFSFIQKKWSPENKNYAIQHSTK